MAEKEMTSREHLQRQEMTSVLAHPLLGAYIGPNAEGYLTLWREQLESRKYYKQPWGFVILFSVVGWPIWYAYRKMYKELILCFIGSIVIGAILQFILPGASLVGISVGLAFAGKQFYYAKVSSFFKKNGHLPQDELFALAQKKGGVNLPAAIIVAVLEVLLLAFMIVVAAMTAAELSKVN